MKRIRQFIGRGLADWSEYWRNLEGPELEPGIWHSHYLSASVSTPQLLRLGSQLHGLVIDIGAGTGHGARYLDNATCEYFPTDLDNGRSPSDLRISSTGQRPVLNCSVYQIPVSAEHFDGAMMLSVMEHLEFPQRALAECFRVLRPGGLILISVPFAFPVHGAPHDYRRWTLAGMHAELMAAGFEVVEAVSCGGGFSSLTMNFHLLIRYGLSNGPKWLRTAIQVLLPIIFLVQTFTNAMAIALDGLDRSGLFPLANVVLARRPRAGSGMCAE